MGWIKFEDKPPPEATPVLVANKDGDGNFYVFTAAHCYEEGGWHWETLSPWGSSALNRLESYEWDDDYEFEYWMPIPTLEGE